MSSFQKFMNTNNEQRTLTPGQSNTKPSSISKSVLQIYRQNIQGLKWKSDDILDFFRFFSSCNVYHRTSFKSI
jgi:hypothetical protein